MGRLLCPSASVICCVCDGPITAGRYKHVFGTTFFLRDQRDFEVAVCAPNNSVDFRVEVLEWVPPSQTLRH